MVYGNADGFKEYLGARGKSLNCAWNDDLINSALLVASEWLDTLYEDSWIGYKTNGYTQERSWPRKSATVKTMYGWYTFPDNEIPEKVVHATYEAAFRHLTDSNVLQPDFTPSKYKSVSVSGAISVVFSDMITSAADVQTQFPVIQGLMADLIDDTDGKDLSPLTGKAVRV